MPDIGATDDDPLTALHGAQVTSNAAFAADVTRILTPSWQFACHESDLPAPGTAMRFDFCGRSALLVRQADAGIGGFVNACRHRGSRLVDGDATTGLAYCIDGRIRCPAHGWIYDSVGALAVPRRHDRADRSRFRPVHGKLVRLPEPRSMGLGKAGGVLFSVYFRPAGNSRSRLMAKGSTSAPCE